MVKLMSKLITVSYLYSIHLISLPLQIRSNYNNLFFAAARWSQLSESLQVHLKLNRRHFCIKRWSHLHSSAKSDESVPHPTAKISNSPPLPSHLEFVLCRQRCSRGNHLR